MPVGPRVGAGGTTTGGATTGGATTGGAGCATARGAGAGTGATPGAGAGVRGESGRGALVGATIGYLSIRAVEFPLLILLGFGAYVLFNAALSRVGLHVVLGVLRQQRSAELIGAGFFITLLVVSFIPPVDTSWLFDIGKVGIQAVPDTVVEDATRALGRFPTGFFAHALLSARNWLYSRRLKVVSSIFSG